ncbi:MAG: hypothetical protein IKT28_04855, partial [Rikenellaceae bacterium]|nr:hypothetical protein [Rikenellaceae bacterium]
NPHNYEYYKQQGNYIAPPRSIASIIASPFCFGRIFRVFHKKLRIFVLRKGTFLPDNIVNKR